MKKQCLYCKKDFDELIEDKACEDCAKKNVSYSCKTCGEKFPLDNSLGFVEAKQKAYQAKKVHENQVHGKGNKCKTCGKVQGREEFYLATNEETGEQWYLCEPCKVKWEEENDHSVNKCSVCGNEVPNLNRQGRIISGEKNGVWYCVNHFTQEEKPKCAKCSKEIVNSPINQNGKVYCSLECSKDKEDDREREREREREQNQKKWGSDFGQLKPVQRQGRVKTSNNWDQKRVGNYGRQKVCRYCPQTFDWDKSLEFLPAKAKVETELKIHETSCDKKNDQKEQMRLKQQAWEKQKEQKGSPFYTCRKCWGKVCLDKEITDYQQAKKQALKDLSFHEKKECGTGKNIVPILFSPNQGGNQHAPLDYAGEINENDLLMEQDNETEVVYQTSQTPKSNKVLWWGLGIVGVLVVGVIVWLLVKNKGSKEKKWQYQK